MDNKIYTITVFEKCEPDENGWNLPHIGHARTVGFRFSFESAEEVVKTNMCDIWEYCFNYACIEEFEDELYPICLSRKFYKYNKEIDGYEEIKEPEIFHNIASIAFN